jgi:hypothetical protein
MGLTLLSDAGGSGTTRLGRMCFGLCKRSERGRRIMPSGGKGMNGHEGFGLTAQTSGSTIETSAFDELDCGHFARSRGLAEPSDIWTASLQWY